MLRRRTSQLPSLPVLAAALIAGVAVPGACALETRDETLAVGEPVQTLAQDEPAGESVGEPSAEDAPVEGEPGPGDAVDVPPDEPVDGSGETAPVPDGVDGNDQPKD